MEKASKRLVIFTVLFFITLICSAYLFFGGSSMFVISLPITFIALGVVVATIERDIKKCKDS